MSRFSGTLVVGTLLLILGLALGSFLQPNLAIAANFSAAKNGLSTPVSPINADALDIPIADGLPYKPAEILQPASSISAAAVGPVYYRTYGGFEFQPGTSDLTFATTGAGIYAVTIPSGGLSFRRALELPNGAQITGISMYVIDNSPTFNITLQISQNNPSVSFNQTFPSSLSTTNALTSATVQTVSISGSPILIIDNSQYDYSLRYQPSVAGSIHMLVGVRVEFSIPTGFLPMIMK